MSLKQNEWIYLSTKAISFIQIPPPQYPHKYQDKLKEIEVERRKVCKKMYLAMETQYNDMSNLPELIDVILL